ncbi:PspC domain-containing protein [[Clostridium] colinum]|uniref:PspC domain-containing protein n=1 Tax=[Clostridium] colinum TaxID=36835 RepID=UPI002023D19B|nr:PspC domain-containing protein [[Clostridium] colinum]
MKKLYRSNERVLNGVCSGLGIYLGIDPVIIRIIFIIFLITDGFFYPTLAYFIMSSIIPIDSNIIDIEN